MDDIDAKIIELQQQAEQAGAAFREVASMMGQFRAGLLESGFTIEECVPMCVTQLQLWWVSIMDHNKEGND